MNKLSDVVSGYVTTKELAKRYKCTSRTLARWMERSKNPFPQPRLRASGSLNRWAVEDVMDWESKQGSSNTLP